VRGGWQIAKLFSNLSLPVSLQPKAPPILTGYQSMQCFPDTMASVH
jgi:hypothetical protein